MVDKTLPGWEFDWPDSLQPLDGGYDRRRRATIWAMNASGDMPPPIGLVEAAESVFAGAERLKRMYGDYDDTVPPKGSLPASLVLSLLSDAFSESFVRNELLPAARRLPA